MTDADRIEELKSALDEQHLVSHVTHLEQSLDEYKKRARLLQEENERLKRGLLGQKAERFSTNEAQLSLAMFQIAFRHGAHRNQR